MSSHLSPLLEKLLSEQRPACPETIGAWFSGFKAQVPGHFSSIERAILGGRLARCVGHAFTAGYQSALEHLFAAQFDAQKPRLASLCVSESGGNHPRAIESSINYENEKQVLTGGKTFVSGARDAELLFIAAKEGMDSEGRPRIKILALPSDTPGVEIETLPTLSFIPEVSHGKVRFDRVVVPEHCLLAGDGYTEYVKPFRTCEDQHVQAAVLAYMLGELLERNAKPDMAEELLALLSAYTSLVNLDLKHPAGHLVLAGLRRRADMLFKDYDALLEETDPPAHQVWRRDAALMKIAGKAHLARTEKAWSAFTNTPLQ